MEIVSIIILLVVGLVVWVLLHGSPSLDEEEKDRFIFEHSINLKHVQGLPNYGEGVKVKLQLYRNRVNIDKVNIFYDNINKTEVISRTEIVEYNKSSLGRGIAGGLVFGLPGLVLGAVSGIGVKKNQEEVYYFLLSYNTITDNKEINAVFTTNTIGKDEVRIISTKINSRIKKYKYNPANRNRLQQIHI